MEFTAGGSNLIWQAILAQWVIFWNILGSCYGCCIFLYFELDQTLYEVKGVYCGIVVAVFWDAMCWFCYWCGKPYAGVLLFCTTAAGPIVAGFSCYWCLLSFVVEV